VIFPIWDWTEFTIMFVNPLNVFQHVLVQNAPETYSIWKCTLNIQM